MKKIRIIFFFTLFFISCSSIEQYFQSKNQIYLNGYKEAVFSIKLDLLNFYLFDSTLTSNEKQTFYKIINYVNNTYNINKKTENYILFRMNKNYSFKNPLIKSLINDFNNK